MKIAQKIHKIFLHTVEALLVALALLNFLPPAFGIHPFVILSGSMEPAILTGSVIFVNERASPEDLHTGDIITYSIEDTYVTHRIAQETPGSVITKGDANKEADFSPVNRSRILGPVVLSIPYLGYLYDWVSAPLFLVLLLSLLVADVIIKPLCSLSKNISQKKRRKTL